MLRVSLLIDYKLKAESHAYLQDSPDMAASSSSAIFWVLECYEYICYLIISWRLMVCWFAGLACHGCYKRCWFLWCGCCLLLLAPWNNAGLFVSSCIFLVIGLDNNLMQVNMTWHLYLEICAFSANLPRDLIYCFSLQEIIKSLPKELKIVDLSAVCSGFYFYYFPNIGSIQLVLCFSFYYHGRVILALINCICRTSGCVTLMSMRSGMANLIEHRNCR